jgi:hypothetical protein
MIKVTCCPIQINAKISALCYLKNSTLPTLELASQVRSSTKPAGIVKSSS